MVEFKPGDRAVKVNTNAHGTVKSDLLHGVEGDFYVFNRDDNGRDIVLPPYALIALPTDPRREVVARAVQQRDEDGPREWDSVSMAGKMSYLADADAIIAALDALNEETR
jgi:hypothetical protein